MSARASDRVSYRCRFMTLAWESVVAGSFDGLAPTAQHVRIDFESPCDLLQHRPRATGSSHPPLAYSHRKFPSCHPTPPMANISLFQGVRKNGA